MKKILLIGCGHMGKALLDSWVNTNNFKLTVIDPIKYLKLKNKYKNKKVKTIKSTSMLNHSTDFDFIVLAIRPDDLNNVLEELCKIEFSKKTSVISVIAGKRIDLLKEKLKNIKNFFRVMPNIPATIGQGMNCIVSDNKVSNSKKIEVINLFSLSGKSIFLKNEDQIDMSTAISGSGPGFVFNLVDAMEKAAIELGFNKEIAKILVMQTFKGSVNLLSESKLDAHELVNTVATRGGTTEAGLKVMKKNNIHKTFINLTKASYKKAKKQGN